MEKDKGYIAFKVEYTDDDFYCGNCHVDLSYETNFKEKYVCPLKDEPLCDGCLDYLEGMRS